jgi:hypothetical protein
LALTSPTSGDRSVGVVRSRTKAAEFLLTFSRAESRRAFALPDMAPPTTYLMLGVAQETPRACHAERTQRDATRSTRVTRQLLLGFQIPSCSSHSLACSRATPPDYISGKIIHWFTKRHGVGVFNNWRGVSRSGRIVSKVHGWPVSKGLHYAEVNGTHAPRRLTQR